MIYDVGTVWILPRPDCQMSIRIASYDVTTFGVHKWRHKVRHLRVLGKGGGATGKLLHIQINDLVSNKFQEFIFTQEMFM